MLSPVKTGNVVGAGKATVAVLAEVGVLVIRTRDWIGVIVTIGVKGGLFSTVHAIIKKRIRTLAIQILIIVFIALFSTISRKQVVQ
jgi:hypothetical protein